MTAEHTGRDAVGEGRDAAPGRTPRTPVISGAIGNALEWYDFGVYGYFSVIIAQVFFPNSDAGLLLTFATFGVGFLMRPLGGFVFGHFGDRVGRRTTLIASVGIMGVATFIIGLIPSYASIGIWAPVLLLVFRLVQGFSVGGEYAGSASFLVEYASPQHRGLVGSIQSVSVFLGSLAGSLSGLLVTSLMSEEAVLSYGWRIPFLSGLLLCAVALFLRLRVEDTPAFRAILAEGKVEKAPLVDLFRTQYVAMTKLLCLAIFFTVSYYIVLIYIPSYLIEEVGFSSSFSFLATSLVILFGTALVAVSGHLSDRVGRKPLLITAAVATVVLSFPAFLVVGSGAAPYALLGLSLLMLPVAVLYGVAPTAFAELLPTRLRYGGFSIPYNIATSLFGGFAPFIATWLIRVTDNPLSPSFYMIFAALVALVALLTFRETAKAPLT